MRATHLIATLSCAALAIAVLVWLGVRNYGGNVSALLHMDVPFGEKHAVPEGVVLYEDAAYDGMLYYQVARELPALFGGGEMELDSPYRFQRVLLPLFVRAVSFGDERAFPYALLAINVASALGALALGLAIMKRVSIHVVAVIVNPAVLVGILYSLTEPLSLFFTMLFLAAWQGAGRAMNAVGVVALTLSLFARETTVFLMGMLFLWYLWRRQWRDALLVVLPVAPFVAWQQFLALRFGDIGFQANSNIVSFPFGGPIALIQSQMEHVTLYGLSSLALLAFVLPACVLLARDWLRKGKSIDVLAFVLSGLCVVMLCLDPHMWGALTSVGRVVTPIYPVYALYAAERGTRSLRVLSIVLIVISVVAAVGIASVPHPFRLS